MAYLEQLAHLLFAGDMPLMLFGTIFVAIFMFVLAGSVLFGPADPVQRRLSKTAGTDPRERSVRASARSKSGRSSLNRMLKRFEMLGPSEEWKLSRLRRRLVQAGYLDPKATNTYYMIRLLCAAGLLLGFMPFAAMLSRHVEFRNLALLAVSLGLFGYFLPALWVALRIHSRQWSARLGFPDSLDMLLVCVEAGLSLDAALNRVSEEIHTAFPVLGEQYALVAAELRAGQQREIALRNFAERIGIQEASSLVTLLVQSERLGASIAQTLRVHANEIRDKRMVRAEEKANLLPVKLSVPLVLFVLPALFVVILTPAVIGIMRVLMPALA